jgi:phosphoglucosamine mutase
VCIGCAPDGFNINAGYGATAPGNLIKAVVEHGADYGVALDGDADRLQLVDRSGRLYNGDELLYVMVHDRLAQGQAVPGAVGTLMTNMAVEQALRARDVDFVRAKVGDRYVLEELVARGWLLGGEGSGHLLALDRHTTGDGLVSALQVLQAVARAGKPLPQLLAEVTLFPQVLINVRLSADQDWRASQAFAATREAVERELGAAGRVLVRASGTEPVVRVMVEARDAAQARQCAERLAQSLDQR